MYEAIIEHYHEGIVAVDHNEKIYTMNPKAEKFLNIKMEHAVGKQLKEIYPFLDLHLINKAGKSFSEEVIVLNGEEVIINKFPIQVEDEVRGAIFVFQTASNIQKVESRIRHRHSLEAQRVQMHFNHLVANSGVMNETVQTAKQYSKADFPILIYGEPGTGKQSIAQAIHYDSGRRDYPFVFLNCEAYNEEQLEIEIFGYHHKEGGQGVFELAHGGTLFIDAIGNMPMSIQARLINVLTEKKIMQ